MSIRDKSRREAERFLAPTEEIQEVMLGVCIAPWKVLLFSQFGATIGNYRAIVCTDRRTILIKMGPGDSLEQVLESIGRSARLGPPSGYLFRLAPFASPVWVAARFFADIRRADEKAPPEQ